MRQARYSNRRQFMQRALSTAAMSMGLGTAARAASWPARPVSIIVPYVAGGTSDMMARLCAQFMTEKLGKTFIVENRAGGSGVPAATVTATADRDGCTVLFGPPAPIVTVPMLQKVSYNTESFAPINIFASYPFLLGIKASLPVQSLQELIAYMKAHPGKLNYSSAGFGSISHLVGALFASQADIKVVHVPYKGAAPATTALMTGEVDFYFGGSSELIPHMSSTDKIRIIATSGTKRLANLPDLPAVGELISGFALETWNGFVGPRGIPEPIVNQFAEAIRDAAMSPTIKERLQSLAIYPVESTPAEFAKTIASDKAFYQAALKAAGMI
jgi:tripartite-type tricarboxylate transporter receptor subunit TctC